MIKLPNTNRGWKPLFIRMTDSNEFGVDLQWRVAKVSGNQAPNLSKVEHKDFDEISGYEFPYTLVLDREELDKFWWSAVLFVANSLITAPIDPEFQIGEPN